MFARKSGGPLVSLLIIATGLIFYSGCGTVDFSNLTEEELAEYEKTVEENRWLKLNIIESPDKPEICRLDPEIGASRSHMWEIDDDNVYFEIDQFTEDPDFTVKELRCNGSILGTGDYSVEEQVIVVRLLELPDAVIEADKLNVEATLVMGETPYTDSVEVVNSFSGNPGLAQLYRKHKANRETLACYKDLAEYFNGRDAEQARVYAHKAYGVLQGSFDQEVWNAEADALRAERKFAESADLYEKLFRETGESIHADIAAILNLYELKNISHARYLLEAALERDPENCHLYELMSETYIAEAYFAEAVLELKRGLAVEEDNASLKQALENLYIQLDLRFTNDPEKHYQKKLADLKSDTPAYNAFVDEINALLEKRNHLVELSHAGEFNRCLDLSKEYWIREWPGLFESMQASCYNSQGVQAAAEKRWEEAAKLFRQAFYLDPRGFTTDESGWPVEIPFRSNAAAAYWNMGLDLPTASEERIEKWRLSAKFKPENPEYLACAETGRTLLESLVDSFASMDNSMDELAKAQKEQDEALEDLNKFIDENPDLMEGLVEVFEDSQEAPVGESTQGQFEDLRDGRIYKTIQVGDLIWLAEDFAFLPNVEPMGVGDGPWVDGYYGKDVKEAQAMDSYQARGCYYSWGKARELAPPGWRLPTYADWQALLEALGAENAAGNLLKASGVEGWSPDDNNAAEKIGFNARPAGLMYHDEDSFLDKAGEAACYRVDGIQDGEIMLLEINGPAGTVSFKNYPMGYHGMNVRYVRDVGPR